MRFRPSNFKDSLKVEIFHEKKDGMRMRLLEHVSYYRKGEPGDSELIDEEFLREAVRRGERREILIPAGYVSDGATIPKAFWWILSPFEDYLKCCIIHDWLCDLHHLGYIQRSRADKIFAEALKEAGIKASTRFALVFFVRFYGVMRYNLLCEALFGRGKVEAYNEGFFEKREVLKILRGVL